MKSKEVRKTFLEFFNAKKHEIVRSSSLIPKNDPTLLFTNAGMVPFKSVFLGEEKRPYVRAASCQKSLRAGGKHNDLENVGHTARHHTFFEMLGNFSFGDYFKKDAILFAWELLTEWYKLPKEKLWVSVYEEDDEAAKLWNELTGIPLNRIIRLGAKDNFWQMGDTGPCGPCSEILIDQGKDVGCKNSGCSVGCDCDRFLELWNLVFMQYNRDSSGKLTPLPKPSIDTGMGMERITAVVQSKHNNFDTDLFSQIISDVTSRSKKSYGKDAETDVSIRVIADHIRAIAFLLTDGLMPSNEGRGYVLRRIIRRASRHAKMLGFSEPVLFNFIDSVAGTMGDVYPELIDEKDRASKVLRFEEERFSKTLEQGMKIIDEVIASAKKSGLKTLPGSDIFKLYDTFGFPVDLARDIASDNGLMLDESGFNKEMEMQRDRAKASWVGEEEAISSIYKELFTKIGKTEFIGYETLNSESVIKAILKDGKIIKEASKGETVEIFLDKTPFYGESGGQAGDTGEISSDDAQVSVKDTKKVFKGLYSHIVKIKEGRLKTADKVNCAVDEAQRKSTMRNHTSTHLLQASLRNIVGEHVKQSGSFVSSERLRFDFTHFFSLSNEEIKAIEDMVNQKILENISVETKVMDRESAVSSGAMALFGEKYGDKVRVISVPGFSSELCGGTHCKATGDIGAFVIVSEGSVASGIRRIEAFTGASALEYFREKENELKNISESLKTDKPVEKVEKLLSEMKELEKQLEKFKGRAASDHKRDYSYFNQS
jgi:alanyl-tRNA synthetase